MSHNNPEEEYAMRLKNTGWIGAMVATIFIAYANMAEARPARCDEAGWITKCCGVCAMMPTAEACTTEKNDGTTFVDRCCPDEAKLEIEHITFDPMKPNAGMFASAWVSISNVSDVETYADVTISVTCHAFGSDVQTDSATMAFIGEYFGPLQTRHDFVLQWMTTVKEDCLVTAKVAYTVASCGDQKITVESSPVPMWVLDPLPPNTCTCETEPCQECQTCEICTPQEPCKPGPECTNNDPCIVRDGFKDVLWDCKERQMRACPGRITKAESKRIKRTCMALLRYCRDRKIL
ncbi:MAG: hypothetical protein AAB372_03260 [Patescibacteria group bacterium]